MSFLLAVVVCIRSRPGASETQSPRAWSYTSYLSSLAALRANKTHHPLGRLVIVSVPPMTYSPPIMTSSLLEAAPAERTIVPGPHLTVHTLEVIIAGLALAIDRSELSPGIASFGRVLR